MLNSGLKRDECGWYAWWSGTDTKVWYKESLRTQDQQRAEQWRISGVCHGVGHHEQTCERCKNERTMR